MTSDRPRRQLAKQAARRLLLSAGVSMPPIPVRDLVKAKGLSVEPMNWGPQSKLDALLFHREQCVALNVDKSQNRQRFSLAHELGHYVLDHHYLKREYPLVDLDHPPEHAHPRSGSYEIEANVFAGELLVPGEMLRRYRPARPHEQEDDPSKATLGDLLPPQLRSKPGEQPQLDEDGLAKLFHVSREVMYIALQENRLL